MRGSNIEEILSTIEKEVSTEETSPWIEKKLDAIKNKASMITNHRQKRGLFNIIGKGSKWLFGTMDEEDNRFITEHIEMLEQNNSRIIQGINQQIKINDYFNDTLNLLNQNQNTIIQQYSSLSREIRNLIKYQKMLDIALKLQVLESKIDQILDNMASIKMGILHPGILTSEEIREFNITMEKLENARTSIIRMDSDKLLINIQIPTKFSTTPYKLLIPIPNKDFYEIAEEPQTFIETERSKYVMENKIMYRKELKNLKTCLNTECLSRINRNEAIIKLNNNIVLGINLKKPQIVNKCDERNLELVGNYFFNIQNCTLIINNITYKHFSKEFEDNNIFELFHSNWENKNFTIEKIVMRHVQNLEEIKLHRNVNFAINGIVLIIVITVIIILIYINCYRQTGKFKIQKQMLKIKTNCLHQESKPDLKEGGVILDHISPPNIPNFSIKVHELC